MKTAGHKGGSAVAPNKRPDVSPVLSVEETRVLMATGNTETLLTALYL
jgi:hypothetical protein